MARAGTRRARAAAQNPTSPHRCDRSQIAAFRLARLHLSGNVQAEIVAVAGDVCGIQARLASAAELAMWARVPGIKRADISAALWKQRTLVKTLCMRQTLHWIRAADFSIYITALKSSRLAAVMSIASRFGVTQADVDRMNRAVVEALGAGALTRRELVAAVKPQVNKAVQNWMGKLWNPFRAALIEGLICYGPERAQEITFQRTEQWLQQQPVLSESGARQHLLRGYLRTYAPATLQDFAKWAGMPMNEVRSVFQAVQDELVEVDIEGTKAKVVKTDLDVLMNSGFQQPVLVCCPPSIPTCWRMQTRANCSIPASTNAFTAIRGGFHRW